MAINLKYPKHKEQRERLIEMVAAGKIEKEKADSLAIAQGLGPLERNAEPSKFAMEDVRVWSIEMAVAWIVWREHQKVVLFYDPYRAACYHWTKVAISHFFRNPGSQPKPLYKLAPRSAAKLQDIVVEWESNGQRSASFEQSPGPLNSERQLLEALIEGQLEATAVQSDTGRLRRIDPMEWGVLSLNLYSSSIPGCSAVLLWRSDIERLWPQPSALKDSVEPPHTKSASLASGRSVASEAAIRAALLAACNYVQAMGYRPLTKAEAEECLVARFGKPQRALGRPQIKALCDDGRITGKQGPQGPRNPNRQTEMEEVRQFLKSAKLQNSSA